MDKAREEFEVQYAEQVNRVNRFLLQYGLAVAPHFIIAADFNKLDAYCQGVTAKAPQDRKTVHDEIRKHLAPYAFLPHGRACAIYRITQLPHLRLFGHLIERGVLHYYKQDFLSSVLTMLPAIEGVLRAHLNYPEGKSSFKEIITLLQQTGSSADEFLRRRHPLYRDILVDVLDTWIYRPTGLADFDLSHLNRHYALHGLGQGNYYSRPDCERLFLLFDLYAETLVCETGVGYANFLPGAGQNPFVDARMAHYIALLTENPPLNHVIRVEEGFMRDHAGYVPVVNFATLS